MHPTHAQRELVYNHLKMLPALRVASGFHQKHQQSSSIGTAWPPPCMALSLLPPRSHRIIFKFINSLLVLVISRCWDPLVVFFHRGPVSAYLLHKFFKNGLPWKYMRDATTIRATAIWPVNSTRWRSAVPFDAYMWLALVIMISATIKSTTTSATIATMLQPHHLLRLWICESISNFQCPCEPLHLACNNA